MRFRSRLWPAGLAAVIAFGWSAGICRATIFSALSSTTTRVKTDFGIARVDESKNPSEIAIGEMRAVWEGYWQFSGGKIEIHRAEDTDLVLHQASATFKFKARWVAGNEAVAKTAKHWYRMKIVRVEGLTETAVENVRKDVSVGGKGLGGTVFKDGSLSSSEITVAGPAKFKIILEAGNSNTKASRDTAVTITIRR